MLDLCISRRIHVNFLRHKERSGITSVSLLYIASQSKGFHAVAARAGESRAETRTPTYWVRVVVTIASLSLRVDSFTLYLRFMDSCQLWCHTPLTLSGDNPSVSALLPTAQWAGFRSYGYGSSN